VETIHFDNELLILKADISKLLSLVLESFEMSIRAIEDGDERLAIRVKKLDDPIDDINRKVEESVYQIIARFNPMGKDLRYTITMIKFSNNLERIGDLSVNIAQKAITLFDRSIVFNPPPQMRQMIGHSMQMIKDAFSAFGERNVHKAIEVWKTDSLVDELERKIDDYVMEQLNTEGFDMRLVPILLLLARDIERIADHATNLCEEIVYIETGKDLSSLVEEM